MLFSMSLFCGFLVSLLCTCFPCFTCNDPFCILLARCSWAFLSHAFHFHLHGRNSVLAECVWESNFAASPFLKFCLWGFSPTFWGTFSIKLAGDIRLWKPICGVWKVLFDLVTCHIFVWRAICGEPNPRNDTDTSVKTLLSHDLNVRP